MASCRFAIYPIVAVAATNGLSSQLWIAATLMAAYILAVTLLAKGESQKGPFLWTKTLWLAIPLLAIVYQAFCSTEGSALAVLAIAAWIAYVFYAAKRSGSFILGKTIGPLLAGICLVDLAILGSASALGWPTVLGFVAFFIAALLAQRSIPAS